MVKTKSKFKLLIVLGIMLLAVLVFNMNTVNAATQEEIQTIMNLIPNTIQLDILESQALDRKSGEYGYIVDDLAVKKVETILENSGVDLKAKNIKIGTGGIDIIVKDEEDTDLCFNIHKIGIGILEEDGGINNPKVINIKYKNTDNFNTQDEQYVKDKIKNVNFSPVYSVEFEDMVNQKSSVEQELINCINKEINDETLKYIVRGQISGTYPIYIFKNDILYYTVCNNNPLSWIQVTIPTNIENTETAKINYAQQIIKNGLEKIYNRTLEISIEKYTDKIYNGAVENNGSFYALIVNGEKWNPIELKKSGTENVVHKPLEFYNKETNIRIETTENILPEDTILDVFPILDGIIYRTVSASIQNCNNFKVFDITIKSRGVRVQPNGKVKVSIPIPSNFDKTKLSVYRVEDNGEKTEYEVTVEGNYATFETNHFSTYVLAEKEITQNTNNKTDKEKDNTPKTGNLDIINYVLVVTALAGAGIIVLKKHSK